MPAKVIGKGNGFDVVLAGKVLAYVKPSSCDAGDIDASSRFFLRVSPADPGDLADDRRAIGHDNLDFAFADAGVREGDVCAAYQILPAYEVGRIETGQFNPGSGQRSWESSYTTTRPVFDATAYSFTVPASATVGHAVGTVRATDAGDATVIYAIASGNVGGAFALNETSGALSLAEALDDLSSASYQLTVAARDPAGVSSAVTVTVTVAGAGCTNGATVATPNDNHGLVRDCETLLAAKDRLRGTGTLNWSTGTAIGSWEGVTTGGAPSRVTGLDLSDKRLGGTIPAELSGLTGLSTLRLSGNQFSGCIPTDLRGLAAAIEARGGSHDLAQVALAYCDAVALAPANLSASPASGTSVSVAWDAAGDAESLSYRVEYRAAGSDAAWTVGADDLTTATHVVEGLSCETAYEFRVSARGDGVSAVAAWSEPSAPVSATTGVCNQPPVFDAASYTFTVSEVAAVGTVVGTIVAQDSADDTLTYAITAGNEAGAFAIDAAGGVISVAGALDYETTTSYTLTIEARDGNAGAATVTAQITVTDVAQVAELCGNGVAVSNPAANVSLVSDCVTLLTVRDALAGAGALNWSADTAIGEWDGVTIGGAPGRVTRLSLTERGLTGRIPAELSGLSKLIALDLRRNQLTGGIPAALGGLADLKRLSIGRNQLTGAIPVELGGLSKLITLDLRRNQVTGDIPPELGGLTNLEILRLADNQLTGCIPAALRDARDHDLDAVRLPTCGVALDPPPAPQGLAATAAEAVGFVLQWEPAPGTSVYRVEYRVSGADEWTIAAEDAAETAYTVGELVCGTSYDFRVSAYGEGVNAAAAWGAPSAVASATTDLCNQPPVFEAAAYDFTIEEDAAIGAVVGSVAATDPDDGDVVAYAITAGNDDGAFAIDAGSGSITLAGALDHEAAAAYTLTVEVSDGRGGTATAMVTVTVRASSGSPP